jgi:hypothetical protein
MAGRKLKSRSVSLGRYIDKVSAEQSQSEPEPLDPGAEAELASVEINSANDRALNVYCESNDSGGLSANQFQDFMSTVMKEFSDLKESMNSL